MSNIKKGVRVRTPSSSANRWEKTSRAFLGDRFTVPVFFRIQTVDTDGTTNLDVTRVDHLYYGQRVPGQRYSIDWSLDRHEGGSHDLARMAERVIHIASTPPSTGDNPIHPFNDVLFREGGLELQTPPAEGHDGQALHLGRIVGLTIVTDAQTYPVWTP